MLLGKAGTATLHICQDGVEPRPGQPEVNGRNSLTPGRTGERPGSGVNGGSTSTAISQPQPAHAPTPGSSLRRPSEAAVPKTPALQPTLLEQPAGGRGPSASPQGQGFRPPIIDGAAGGLTASDVAMSGVECDKEGWPIVPPPPPPLPQNSSTHMEVPGDRAACSDEIQLPGRPKEADFETASHPSTEPQVPWFYDLGHMKLDVSTGLSQTACVVLWV